MKENKDNFDDKLSHKIKSTFENHQEPFDPALWQSMQQRLKTSNKSKGIVAFWKRKPYLFILGLFFALGLGYVLLAPSQQNPSKEKPTTKQYSNSKTIDSKKNTHLSTQNDSAKTTAITENTGKADKLIYKQPLSVEEKTQQKVPQESEPLFIQEKEKNQPLVNSQTKGIPKQFLAAPSKESKLKNLASLGLKTASFHLDSLVMPIIAQQQTAQDSTQDQAQTAKNALRVALMLNFGKGFGDKASQFESKLGLGVGVGLSIPIAKKWSFQTGILLQNYQWQSRESGLELLDRTSLEASSFSGLTLLSEYEYSLQTLWLEIPLNINYTLLHKPKWSLEASAGLSSFIYLKERYTFPDIVSETVQVQNPTTGEISNQTRNNFAQNTTDNPPFGRFEGFNMVNIGCHLNIPFGQKYRLGIAPHYQFSLSEMTQFQFKTHLLGVGLQLDFLSNQKRRSRKSNQSY